MAVYDYFYTFENFIGYTGDIACSPTLYFLKEGYYGRITTQHSHQDNVGRAAPKLLDGYSFGNYRIRNKGVRLYEKNKRLKKRHVSRNRLIFCTSENDRSQVKARVLYLISVNTEIKAKDDGRVPKEFIPRML